MPSRESRPVSAVSIADFDSRSVPSRVPAAKVEATSSITTEPGCRDSVALTSRREGSRGESETSPAVSDTSRQGRRRSRAESVARPDRTRPAPPSGRFRPRSHPVAGHRSGGSRAVPRPARACPNRTQSPRNRDAKSVSRQLFEDDPSATNAEGRGEVGCVSEHRTGDRDAEELGRRQHVGGPRLDVSLEGRRLQRAGGHAAARKLDARSCESGTPTPRAVDGTVQLRRHRGSPGYLHRRGRQADLLEQACDI